MKAVIVEDEYAAAENLKRLLASIDDSIDVIKVLQNVDESVEWFSLNPMPDIVFMDIHLADGDSFSIFKSVEIECPIIFITAYDQYALKAFEVNSVDYLLKPISKRSLQKSLNKLKQLSSHEDNSETIARLMESLNKKSYKKSFLIPSKDKLIPLSSDDIAFVYAHNKKALTTCFSNRQYTMDSSLDEFLKQLDPALFYRANRQFIISHKAITDLTMWFDGKLAVNLSLSTPERIIVSRSRSSEFKKWYVRGD